MFKWLISFLFPTKEEVETPGVLIHDFTDRVVGHDIAMTIRPTDGTADALITSLEKIQVGEIIAVVVGDEPMDFFVKEVEELEPMVFRAKLETAQ
ncbi:hypothetical protein pEaSNUABM56_00058 [Erwinia phage pEa_SNUABM_56]|uniref:Uncharacterized protein n=1 Tax=Erwinia phage pEp_SNUABM_01 TaxID=2601643 RepID=A0A5J6DAL8_9CAUD|nr:hypothetical protein HWC63_gp032 [Erwinia phage pEp_SNUABM_01]QEQ94858.1 hypothetical protein pEpSNUABM01_032 [Erwinia phage pEp_SNUABM_01]UYL85103.1 hypothetical protein pEaSNUABM56_00058 [Erwinia phage pEa_SNUABM_56]